jgi:hypothetical protein
VAGVGYNAPVMFARFAKTVRWSAPLAALVVLGCSTIQFAYNNIDWVLVNKINHYLNLTAAQRKRAKQIVAARMEAHRREELPIYIATLQEVRVMLADDLSPAELEIIKKQIPAVYKRTMRDTIPGIAILLSQIDDAQIDHLQSRIDDRNREFRREFMPDSMPVRLERRVRRSIEIIEYFIGELRSEQVALIAEQRNAMPLTADDWLAYHQINQQALLAMLRRGAAADELQGFLVGWWVDLANQPAALDRKMEINTDAWTRLLLDLDATVDAEQRQKLLDKLDLFIDAFSELLPEEAA